MKQVKRIELFEIVDEKYYHDGKELRVRENSQGYQYVRIDKEVHRLHRVIALKHIPNPLNHRIIDHKDGNKTNNSIENLQWISHKENSKKAYNNNDSMKKMHLYNKKDGPKKKIASEKDGVITIHDSLRKCAEYLSRDVAAVYRVLQGEWNRCNGHILYYIED